MKRVLVVASSAVALTTAATALSGDRPVKSQERVVLQTELGDLVLALYPSVAPRTVMQFERLVLSGAYDGTHFVRIEPGFVIQLSTTDDRPTPLSPEQRKLVQKLPLEGSSLRHEPYVLSLAHPDDDPNAGETSFSVLTGPAPHLDGKYTIFGEVEDSADVVRAIEHVPLDPGKRPLSRVSVLHAFVLPGDAVGTFTRRPASRPAGSARKLGPTSPGAGSPAVGETAAGPVVDGALAAVVAGMTALGLATFVFAGRSGARVVASLGLIQALLGFFACFALLVPVTNRVGGALGVVVFLGALLTFRLMGSFEAQRAQERPHQGPPGN